MERRRQELETGGGEKEVLHQCNDEGEGEGCDVIHFSSLRSRTSLKKITKSPSSSMSPYFLLKSP